jgi:hypothetical protein
LQATEYTAVPFLPICSQDVKGDRRQKEVALWVERRRLMMVQAEEEEGGREGEIPARLDDG